MVFGIYSKQTQTQIQDALDYITTLGAEYTFITPESNLDNIDCVIIFGGDGTILRIATPLAMKGIPALCLNCGNIGFLTDFEYSEYKQAISSLVNNTLTIDERALITITGDNLTPKTALNELIVQRNCGNVCNNLIIKLDIKINGKLVDEITGDGVIITTPSGSTAYSLSAGGAIMSPGVQAFGITPVCAHSFHNRPIICSDNSTITIENNTDTSALLIIDGIIAGEFNQKDQIKIEKSQYAFKYFKRSEDNFFDKLKTKLYRRG